MGEIAGKVLAALSAALLTLLLVGSTVAIAAPPVVNDPDDDAAIVWINDIEVDEDEGLATFTIYKYGRTTSGATVDVVTMEGTATAGSDYAETTATITLPRRRIASRAFTVPIVDDAVDEKRETFLAVLANPVGVSIEGEAGVATIVDNDEAGVFIDEGDGLYVLEGGDSDLFEIRFRSAPAAPVTVNLLSDDSQVSLSSNALTVDAANWSDPQQLELSAVEDGMEEDDPHATEIVVSLESADTNYDSLELKPIPVTIGDADALLVSILGPNAGAPNQPVSFEAVVNAGIPDEIIYDWTAYYAGNPVAEGAESEFVFAPTDPGPYIVRAVVGDDQGQNPAVFVEFTVLGDIASSVFAQDIVWLANEGITFGCNPPDNDQFCPDKTVTRGQMAAFLVRAVGLSDDGGGNLFDDDDGSVFESDIDKLATAGITRGCNADGTQFCPNKTVTRGQMAAFLNRAGDLLP